MSRTWAGFEIPIIQTPKNPHDHREDGEDSKIMKLFWLEKPSKTFESKRSPAPRRPPLSPSATCNVKSPQEQGFHHQHHLDLGSVWRKSMEIWISSPRNGELPLSSARGALRAGAVRHPGQWGNLLIQRESLFSWLGRNSPGSGGL